MHLLLDLYSQKAVAQNCIGAPLLYYLTGIYGIRVTIFCESSADSLKAGTSFLLLHSWKYYHPHEVDSLWLNSSIYSLSFKLKE